MKNRLGYLAAIPTLLFFVAAQQAHATIPLQMTSGAYKRIESQKDGAQIEIDGKKYPVSPNLVITGAKSLRDIPAGASVTAIVGPDGNIQSISVVPANK